MNLVVETLYALAERPEGSSIRAIAQETGNSRSSTHRILQYLAIGGYAEQTQNGSYVVGSRLVSLSARVFGVVPVLQIAGSIMRKLVEDVGETCYLATYSPGDDFCTYVHRVESAHLVRHVQPLGGRIPLHAGAVGKAILASLPSFDFESLDLVAYTPHTLTSVAGLEGQPRGRAPTRICDERRGTRHGCRRRGRSRQVGGDGRRSTDRLDTPLAGRPGRTRPDRGGGSQTCRRTLLRTDGDRRRAHLIAGAPWGPAFLHHG